MIRATFAGFNIAASGMAAAQRSLDVTGNNMANLNTMGFTRQRLDLNSIPSGGHNDRFAPTGGVSVGDGVRMTQMAQLRDPHLDRRFRNEASAIGELNAHAGVMNSISRIFDEIQFEQGVFRAMQDFRTQMQRLSNQPGEATIDATVASSAQSMLRMFQMYSMQLASERDYQNSLLDGHGGAVSQINTMLENVALLNRHIRESELFGNPALELKDQRNLLIDQLSAYMRIEVHLTPDPDMPGIDILSITFMDDNPNLSPAERTLVNGLNYTNLQVGRTADGDTFVFKQTPQPNNITKRPNMITDPDPLNHPGQTVTVTDPDDPTGTIDIKALSFRTGALRGSLDMLNSKGAFDNPPNTLNGIGYYERVLDRMVADFAHTFNEANMAANPLWSTFSEYQTAVSSGGTPATPPALADLFAELQDFANAVEAADIASVPRPTPPAALAQFFDHNFATAGSGFMAYIDDVISGAATLPPDLTNPNDPILNIMNELLSRPLFESEDGLPINAKNIQVATGWTNGSYMMTTTRQIASTDDETGDFSGATDQLMYMLSLFQRSFNFTTDGIDGTGTRLFTSNFEQMFRIIGVNAASDASSRDNALLANTNVIMGIEDMRNSISSVSMDEEGVNLIRFQQSFAASARVMTSLDEALDVLINRTGIVGR